MESTNWSALLSKTAVPWSSLERPCPPFQCLTLTCARGAHCRTLPTVSKGSSRRAPSPRGRSANRSRSPTSPSREHSSSPSRGKTLGRLSPSRGEPGHHRNVALKGPRLRIVVPRAAAMAQQHPQLHHLLPMLPRSCLIVPEEALAVAAYRCALAGRPPLDRRVPAPTPTPI